MPQDEQLQHWRRLKISEVEKAFTQIPIDIHKILALAGIGLLSSPPACGIRSHALYDPLPDILIKDTGDRYAVLDRIQREAATLIAIVRVRKSLRRGFRDASFCCQQRWMEGWIAGI